MTVTPATDLDDRLLGWVTVNDRLALIDAGAVGLDDLHGQITSVDEDEEDAYVLAPPHGPGLYAVEGVLDEDGNLVGLYIDLLDPLDPLD
jgi:hypothetical protein